ncbi:MAG TPA: hypothetical protein DCQ90_10095 [Erysipelotrichaceae bacterium]|nr:hypothetical protein [Erysipelotrichaceae bacterium]
MIKTEEQKSEFKRMLDYYDTPFTSNDQGTLITILKETQKIFGCVPNEEILEIARVMKSSEGILKSMIRRFPSLLGESATHTILMCNGERCENRKSFQLIKDIEKYLDCSVGQTTKDKKFELKTQHCLRRCMEGPNLNIDSDQYGAMTLEKFKEIVRKYK